MDLKYLKPKEFIIVVGSLWTGVSWLLSLLHDQGYFYGFGSTAIVMLLVTWYDKKLWKVRFLNLLNSIPDLNGKYEGWIEYNFEGVDGQTACSVDIQQTLSCLKFTSFFDKKKAENNTDSDSTEAIIKTDEHGDHQLIIHYHNPGSKMQGDTLNAHDGVNILKVKNEGDEVILEGYYFTNRNPQTKGKMKLTKIK